MVDCKQGGLVRGVTWKVRMLSGAIFETWSPSNITRQEAIQRLLSESNGDYEGDEVIYTTKDIDHIWMTNNIRSRCE